jgi:hypothetical protein
MSNYFDQNSGRAKATAIIKLDVKNILLKDILYENGKEPKM